MAVAEQTWGIGQEREQTLVRGKARPALPWLEIGIGVAIFCAAFVVYLLTLTPSLSYNSLDGNELATVPYVLGLAHSTGYPVYTWLGKLFTYVPAGDIAHRMNLMSATLGALSAALLFVVIKLVLRPAHDALSGKLRTALVLAAAVFGALMFAFSTTLWSQAVIAEVYAPNAFMVALTVVLLLSWARYEESRHELRSAPDGRSIAMYAMFALVYGLSLGTHMSNLALAPGFVLFTLLTNWRVLKQPLFPAMAAAGFGIGLLQYAWLPLKAADLNDPRLARNTPSDLEGIYNYTLNAFPQMRWAYALEDLPHRVVLYLNYVLDNFHLTGALLALAGAWAMAWRHPKAFFLFAPAYLVEVVFFLEYAVGDLDVFFITSHLLLTVFVAYGALALAEALLGFAVRRWLFDWVRELALGRVRFADDGRRAGVGLGLASVIAGVLLFIVAQPAMSLAANWRANDQSANTGINDLYKLAFAELPQGATLSGQSGVFGYDMFYYRLVYGLRPDISMPGITPGAPRQQGGGFNRGAGANTYTTLGNRGGFGGGWAWPVLAAPTVREAGSETGPGPERQLTLYELRDEAPRLFVRNATPEHEVNASFGNLTLVGYDIAQDEVQAGDAVELKLYWRLDGNAGSTRATVSTKVGDVPYVEQHQLGFGNLQRYLQQQRGGIPSGSLLVEEYRLVVLSSLDEGTQALQIRVDGQGGWVDAGSIEVTK